jgi:glycosyltransferase involved in cell wall biosynthesis
MVKVLILGSKEYPFGTNLGDDPIPSGGMEIYVDDLVPELSKLCKLIIITRKFRGAENHEKKGSIEVFRVPWIKGKWSRNPSFNFFSLIKALNVAGKSDIIYSNAFISGFFALLLGRIFRKPTVYRPAGIGFVQYGFPLRNIFFSLERFVFRKSGAIVFHSEGERDNAQRLFCEKFKNAHVILTGFPVDKFAKGKPGALKKEFGLRDETVITSVSRFVPVKGLEYLIKSLPGISGKVKLLLVGSGPEEKWLKEQSKRMGVEDRIMFAGFRRDIPDILAATDIFVVSSLYEGLPTSLLEAMAAGKACVVTDIGLPVEHMKTGLVVQSKNAEALSEAINILIRDESLRKRLGGNARKFVEDNCTQKMAARKHVAVFSGLVKS